MTPVRSNRLLAAVLLVFALGLGACGGDDGETTSTGSGAGDDHGEHDGGEAAATVLLKPAVFEPAETTIKVGETVKWEWEGGVQHNVNGEGFKSELKKSGTFSHTFEEAGSFEYQCDVHPTTMKGTITVE